MGDSYYRVSTANLYDGTVRNLQARQKSLASLQENLSTGKRVVRPSDDPVAAAQAERALTRLSRLQSEQRQLEVQRANVAQAESTLGDAIDLVQQIRETVVAAGGGTLTQVDRQTYASQLQSLQDQLKDVINRKDANGVPLLGALGSALEPFAGPLAGSPDYLYNGLAGQASSTGDAVASRLDGHAALMFDPVRDGVYGATLVRGDPSSSLLSSAIQTSHLQTLDGASYALQVTTVNTTGGTTSVDYTLTRTAHDGTVTTSTGSTAPVRDGQPMPVAISEGADTVMQFTLEGTPAIGDTLTLAPSTSLMGSVQDAIRGIAGAGDSAAAAQVTNQALAQIDAGLQRLSSVRGYAGELLNRVDRISGAQEQRSIQLEADRSRAEDLDMVQGLSDFQNASVAYEAALKSYAQVQRLSLFDYLG
ncbi:MAG: flagellar hook-associated protein FlgL [Comamonadaceae bacterium]|nr:flagellar hook-associated protein FlgL [Burkholderiales bacterium]MEB2348505.1 flagellar hook-associated protein FlgL [Comamonadaceae bacterium]